MFHGIIKFCITGALCGESTKPVVLPYMALWWDTLTCTNQPMSSWWLQMPWRQTGLRQVISNQHVDSAMTTMSHEPYYILYISHHSHLVNNVQARSEGRLNIKMSSYPYKDSHVKDKRSHDRLIFNMGIPIAGKDGFYIEVGPRTLATRLFPFITGFILNNILWGW